MTRTRVIIGGIGGAGLLLAIVAWFIDPARFAYAWLAALTAWLAWPLGSLVLLLIHALTGGRWGDALRPALLRGIVTLPLLLPALAPLLSGLPTLYPWARAGVPNAFYLNEPFFLGRLALYLVVWFALAAVTLRALRRGDGLRAIAPPGLMLLALTMTFATIDTTMSLDPGFNSSIYGMIELVGAALLALTLALLATVWRAPRGVLADEARIVLGLVILWAYLDFMQFLIVWESDLPQDSAWYLARSAGLWGIVAGVIAVGHFVLPFAALIVPAIRRSRRGIAAVCIWLIAMEILRHWWLVLPAEHAGPGWIELACTAALFGIAAFASGVARRATVAHV